LRGQFGVKICQFAGKIDCLGRALFKAVELGCQFVALSRQFRDGLIPKDALDGRPVGGADGRLRAGHARAQVILLLLCGGQAASQNGNGRIAGFTFQSRKVLFDEAVNRRL